MIYYLSPKGIKVFVDGRSDFYGSKFNLDYIDLMNVKYTWQQTLDRYGVDTILLPVDAPLSGAPSEPARWRLRITMTANPSYSASPAKAMAPINSEDTLHEFRRSKAAGRISRASRQTNFPWQHR